MKDKFLENSINFLKKYESYSDYDIEKLRYGLEGVYLTVTKMIVLIILAIIFGHLKEIFIALFLFNIIRYFGFGFHAEKSIECLFLSIFNFILIPEFFLRVDISFKYYLIISCCCIVIFLLFAPADTIKRPLRNKKKRVIRKVLTTITGLLYLIGIIYFKNSYISSLIISSLVAFAIIVNPITYFIFRQPFNNYKN